MTLFESSSRFRLLLEHDLFRKPVPTPDQVRGRLFRDHALRLGSTGERRASRDGGCVLRSDQGLAWSTVFWAACQSFFSCELVHTAIAAGHASLRCQQEMV